MKTMHHPTSALRRRKGRQERTISRIRPSEFIALNLVAGHGYGQLRAEKSLPDGLTLLNKGVNEIQNRIDLVGHGLKSKGWGIGDNGLTNMVLGRINNTNRHGNTQRAMIARLHDLARMEIC